MLDFCKAEKGNILFIILIAVALFAALSYAVTSSSRSGSQDISKEKSIQSQAIIQFGVALRNAVTKLQLIHQCRDTEISFEHAPFDGSDTNYVNPNSPNDFSCHIFHPDGGNVTDMEDQLTQTFDLAGLRFCGRTDVQNIGTSDCLTTSGDCNELFMLIGFDGDNAAQLCEDLNRQHKHTDLIPVPLQVHGNGFSCGEFKGVYATPSQKFTDSRFIGKMAVCYEYYDQVNYPDYHYYGDVLLAR